MSAAIQLLLLVGLPDSKSASNTLTSLLLMIMKAVLEIDTAHPYSIEIGKLGPFSQNSVAEVEEMVLAALVFMSGRNSLVYGLLVPPIMKVPLAEEITEE